MEENNTAEIIELNDEEGFEMYEEPEEETKQNSKFGLGVLIGTGVTLAGVAIVNAVRKIRAKKNEDSDESDSADKKEHSGILKWFNKKKGHDESEEKEG